jgi:hypothetical protein
VCACWASGNGKGRTSNGRTGNDNLLLAALIRSRDNHKQLAIFCCRNRVRAVGMGMGYAG